MIKYLNYELADVEIMIKIKFKNNSLMEYFIKNVDDIIDKGALIGGYSNIDVCELSNTVSILYDYFTYHKNGTDTSDFTISTFSKYFSKIHKIDAVNTKIIEKHNGAIIVERYDNIGSIYGDADTGWYKDSLISQINIDNFKNSRNDIKFYITSMIRVVDGVNNYLQLLSKFPNIGLRSQDNLEYDLPEDILDKDLVLLGNYIEDNTSLFNFDNRVVREVRNVKKN